MDIERTEKDRSGQHKSKKVKKSSDRKSYSIEKQTTP